jgi:hypothetical protein
MQTVAVFVFGFLALLCLLLSLYSLIKYSSRGEMTSKGISFSAAYLAGMGVFLTLLSIASGVDILAGLCALGFVIAVAAFIWGANMLNLRLAQKGPLNVLRDIVRFIKRQ